VLGGIREQLEQDRTGRTTKKKSTYCGKNGYQKRRGSPHTKKKTGYGRGKIAVTEVSGGLVGAGTFKEDYPG